MRRARPGRTPNARIHYMEFITLTAERDSATVPYSSQNNSPPMTAKTVCKIVQVHAGHFAALLTVSQ